MANQRIGDNYIRDPQGSPVINQYQQQQIPQTQSQYYTGPQQPIAQPQQQYYPGPQQPYQDQSIPYNQQNSEINFKEDGTDLIHSSMTTNLRKNFIKKVYSIVCAQLLLTAVFASMALYSPAFRAFQRKYMWLLWVSICVSCGTACCLTCTPAGRTVPANYIGLLVFTIAESYLVSAVVSDYNANAVYAAALMTAAVTIGVTIYAFTTKTDFTIYGGALFVISFALLGFGLVAIITQNRMLYNFYNLIGVIFYGFYLIYDTQLLVGSGRFKFSTDDYIVAAIQLYLDIIIIFLKILAMFGKK